MMDISNVRARVYNLMNKKSDAASNIQDMAKIAKSNSIALEFIDGSIEDHSLGGREVKMYVELEMC